MTRAELAALLAALDEANPPVVGRAWDEVVWNAAMEHAARVAEAEPRVWGPAPDPQRRIATKLRAEVIE